VSGAGETTEGESGKVDEGRGETPEIKRDRQCLPSESGLTGNSRTGAEEKLVEEDKSRTFGVSSV